MTVGIGLMERGRIPRSLLLPFVDALNVSSVSVTVHDGFSGLSWSGSVTKGAR